MVSRCGTCGLIAGRETGSGRNTERQSSAPNTKPLFLAPRREKASPSTSSLQWLLARYRETTAWSDLSQATRKQRDNIFAGVIETAGQEPYLRITAATIEVGKERRSHTPAQARNFLDAMRGLFRWAKAAGLVKVDPTVRVHNPKRKTTDGFIPWTEDHAAAFRARWAMGTRQRVWLEVLLHTGLRRGDAVLLGRQHIRAGSIKTEKSGFTIEVPIVIRPALQATLDAGPSSASGPRCRSGAPVSRIMAPRKPS